MIGNLFEWLGAHPTVELVSILVFAAAFVGTLVRIAQSRSPLPEAWPSPRDRGH